MIQCKKLSFGYSEQTKVLKDVQFTLEKGHTGVLLGLNGAGKTTLLDCIGNLIPFEGFIKTDPQFRYIKDLPEFCDELIGWDYINMLLAMRSDYFKSQIEILINRIGIHKELEKLIKDTVPYSKKILVLLSSLCLEQETILLDDPFNGLDYQSQMEMIEIIKELKAQNKTLLIATNQLSFGFNIADELFVLHRGKIKTIKNSFPQVKQYENRLLHLIMR